MSKSRKTYQGSNLFSNKVKKKDLQLLKFLRKVLSFTKRIKRLLFLAEGGRNFRACPRALRISIAEKWFFSVYTILTLVMISIMIKRNLEDSPSPYDTILPNPISRFGDYYGVNDEWVRFGWSSPGYGMSYLPSTYLPVEFLSKIEPNPYKSVALLLLSMSICLLIVTLKICIAVSSSTRQRLLYLLLTFSSYPVWFIYGSANLEGLLLLLIFSAYFFMLRSQRSLAALVIGIAASFKVFPVLFLLVILFSGKVNFRRVLSFCSLGFVGPNLIAILVLPGGVFTNGLESIPKIVSNTLASQQMYAELMYFSESGTHFGHSFLNGVHSILGEGFWPTRTVYVFSSFLLFLFCLLPVIINLFRRHEMSLFMLSVVVAIMSCLTPPTSTDYKLWYFLPACLTFALVQKVTRIEKLVFILLPFLLVAKPFLYTGVQPWANANAYIPPMLMMLFILLFVVDSLIRRSFKDKSQVEIESHF